MRARCSVFIATSLDGYIAREDGSLDWLEAENARVPPGEDCGYADFMAKVDVLVMGAKTFATVLAFPSWPYGDKPVWVVSRSLHNLPESLPPSVRLQRGSPSETVALAQQSGYQHLYIDGGRLIQSFLREGLIDEMTITTVPVVLGAGRSLFGELTGDLKLELVSSRAYPFGFIQSQYKVLRCNMPQD